LALGRQFAVPEEVDHFLKGGMLGEVGNIIAEVDELPFSAVYIADAGCGGDDIAETRGFG
jgi:hypothetical protein